MTDRTSESISWEETRALIAARIPQGVIDRLRPVPAGELRHLRTPLRKLRTELVRELSSGDRGRYSTAYDQLAALQLAGILAAATPAEALEWLTSRRLLDVTWPRPGGGSSSPDHHTVLLTLLAPHRDAAFHRELAGRLAAWLPARGDAARWRITQGLALRSGAEPPTTDGYVIGWLREGRRIGSHHREIGEWLADQGLREPVPHHHSLLSWLRAQPRLAEFTRRVFEVPDAGAEFTEALSTCGWAESLAVVAAEGLLDRAELIDLCLGRLLRGDRPGNLRGFLRLYAVLALDADEVLARAGDHVRLAADGAPGAAKAAQAALVSVAERLPAELFVELTGAVLARPEKGLATVQLGRVDAALRRDPAGADGLLPAVAVAFTHPLAAVQEQALRLVARHLSHAAPAVAGAVRAAAADLGPALRPDAHRLLEIPAPPAEPQSGAPVAAVRVACAELPAAPAGPLDTAERLSALMADRVPDPGEFEVVLAALVAEHHRDAAALRAALAPLAARRAANPGRFPFIREVGGALGVLLDVLTGRPQAPRASLAVLLGMPAFMRTLGVVTAVRVHEAACSAVEAPVPLLLATPTAGDGTIDPAVLLDRLAAYRAAGARPSPADLAQALLRVAPPALPAVRAAAAGLGCELPPDVAPPAPRRFHTQTANMPERLDGVGRAPAPVVRIAPCAPEAAPAPEGVTGLLHAVPDPTEYARFVDVPSTPAIELVQFAWVAPWHPETVAAHGVPGAVFRVDAPGPREPNPLLPRLAEVPGEFGPVCHLLLAYGLTASRADNRTAALDFLLAAGAQGRLRPDLLGGWIAALWRLSAAKPNRVLPVLAEAARTGAGRTTWAVLAAVITEFATEPGRRGLADALVLAAECAVAEGIREALPALDALSAAGAPARVRAESARLAAILTG
ncbi:hypothetical protein ACIF6L_37755 [Kitasatospora sp. NPDC086009]|uniref:DUF7824 domain-containing protein n=1 Tax=unclassified Kitasatospora TaxID=2633591 RepID=UPI0037C4F2D6